MKKLLLLLRGYKQIDEVEAEWTHNHIDLNGEDLSLVDYATYMIFYNSRKDKYEMLHKGFRPFNHFMYTELMAIIEFINRKPEDSVFRFFNTPRDYFVQRGVLFQMIEGDFTVDFNQVYQPEDTKTRIMRVKLTHYKEILDSIKSEDSKLIQKMQEYKQQVLLTTQGLDIWQDLGNVIITSEGCYYSMYNEEKKDGQ